SRRTDLSPQDRFIFRLNNFSNNFGKDYLFPVALIFIFNGWLFNLYLIIEPLIICQWGLYFSFFNPVRNLDFIEGLHGLEEHKNWVITADFASRIIISYLIFQTIAAFRKFSK